VKKASKEPEKGRKIPGENLPKHYGKPRLELMVVDPYWLHAYWLIPENSLEEFKSSVGQQIIENSRFIMRVHDVTDIDFQGDNSHGYFDINIDLNAKRWYFNVGTPDRDYLVELGIVTKEGQFIAFLRSNAVRTPRNTISDVVDEKWMSVEADYQKIFNLSGGEYIGKSSFEIRELMTRRFLEELSSHALFSGSSETRPNESKPKDSFWLKVETELIVYGATEPDANVKVCGIPIKLRPDGTFTLRFSLPDGTQEIPVEAESANKKHYRKITPIVDKKTEA
jgi:hypothetical protein